jgi:hypothetical protein
MKCNNYLIYFLLISLFLLLLYKFDIFEYSTTQTTQTPYVNEKIKEMNVEFQDPEDKKLISDYLKTYI